MFLKYFIMIINLFIYLEPDSPYVHLFIYLFAYVFIYFFAKQSSILQ